MERTPSSHCKSAFRKSLGKQTVCLRFLQTIVPKFVHQLTKDRLLSPYCSLACNVPRKFCSPTGFCFADSTGPDRFSQSQKSDSDYVIQPWSCKKISYRTGRNMQISATNSRTSGTQTISHNLARLSCQRKRIKV